MRRTLWALLVILTACSASATPPILQMEDSGSTLELGVGDSFIVNLHGNPTTGFAWLVGDYDETMVVIQDETYTDRSNGRLGAGGEFAFEFEARRSGQTDIELHYRRSWEDVPAERVFTLHLVIG